jgi:hypothetical protein
MLFLFYCQKLGNLVNGKLLKWQLTGPTKFGIYEKNGAKTKNCFKNPKK